MGAAGAIVVPILVLAGLAVLVPRMLALVTGLAWQGMALNLAASAALLTVISGGYFAVLYVASDARIAGAIGAEPLAAMGRFLWLGLMAGLVWAPIAVLSLTAMARHGEDR